MIDFFQGLTNPNVPFIRYALIAGLLSSIPFGIIGSFVVVKRMSYIAGAISHTALGGIGLALYLNVVLEIGYLSPLGGALLFALIAGLIISVTLLHSKERLDTMIGTTWAVGMSIGLIFIYLTPTYVDPMSYLFGNILLVSRSNLITIVFLNVIIAGTSVLLSNQIIAVSFDAEFAKTRGVNTALFEIILVFLVALTVVVLIKIIGIVMVIALLTIPPAIADIFTKRMKAMMIVATILVGTIMTGGLVASYVLGVPTGSTTVLFGGVLFIIAKLIPIPLDGRRG
ncbi:metal ABC transporter permease [Salinispira pacifica]|uniref:Zinc ABC transporter, inner membrane permease protein ZnuB n=1 Tax=Salinispira pacifica TaxID=1307761 RepID=V5WDW1_9SPIO|nr:metal ABC transporter permease [Salinispira pacifica]AHC13810.1 Zinc ABC transporter, inner membrane permease protein ZnuB [Salinispira pacifica]